MISGIRGQRTEDRGQREPESVGIPALFTIGRASVYLPVAFIASREHRLTSALKLARPYTVATASTSNFHSGLSRVAHTTVIPTSWSPRCFLRIVLLAHQ